MCEGDQVVSLLSMATATAAMDPQNSLSILRAHAKQEQMEDMLMAVLYWYTFCAADIVHRHAD